MLGPVRRRPAEPLPRARSPSAPGRVVPYDPDWPRQFEAERARLEATLEPWLDGGIHHIGSTAVPGSPRSRCSTCSPGCVTCAGPRRLRPARGARLPPSPSPPRGAPAPPSRPRRVVGADAPASSGRAGRRPLARAPRLPRRPPGRPGARRRVRSLEARPRLGGRRSRPRTPSPRRRSSPACSPRPGSPSGRTRNGSSRPRPPSSIAEPLRRSSQGPPTGVLGGSAGAPGPGSASVGYRRPGGAGSWRRYSEPQDGSAAYPPLRTRWRSVSTGMASPRPVATSYAYTIPTTFPCASTGVLGHLLPERLLRVRPAHIDPPVDTATHDGTPFRG